MSNKYLSDEICSTANAIINRNELTEVIQDISAACCCKTMRVIFPVAIGINLLFNYASGGGERRSG
jgi:hypothetical protein